MSAWRFPPFSVLWRGVCIYIYIYIAIYIYRYMSIIEWWMLYSFCLPNCTGPDAKPSLVQHSEVSKHESVWALLKAAEPCKYFNLLLMAREEKRRQILNSLLLLSIQRWESLINILHYSQWLVEKKTLVSPSFFLPFFYSDRMALMVLFSSPFKLEQFAYCPSQTSYKILWQGWQNGALDAKTQIWEPFFFLVYDLTIPASNK